MQLENMSDKDFDKLQQQMASEQARRAKIERDKQIAKTNAFFKALTPEIVDLIAPEHGRTSCSDINLANGWSDDRTPRCYRCALLQGWTGNYPDIVYWSFHITPNGRECF